MVTIFVGITCIYANFIRVLIHEDLAICMVFNPLTRKHQKTGIIIIKCRHRKHKCQELAFKCMSLYNINCRSIKTIKPTEKLFIYYNSP